MEWSVARRERYDMADVVGEGHQSGCEDGVVLGWDDS